MTRPRPRAALDVVGQRLAHAASPERRQNGEATDVHVISLAMIEHAADGLAGHAREHGTAGLQRGLQRRRGLVVRSRGWVEAVAVLLERRVHEREQRRHVRWWSPRAA